MEEDGIGLGGNLGDQGAWGVAVGRKGIRIGRYWGLDPPLDLDSEGVSE